ncbi:sensor domain-containing protein [Paenibacillus sp. TRM 82003]|nr:sensor domain-containing protein [Paenibacillus sp. TRM 82003]
MLQSEPLYNQPHTRFDRPADSALPQRRNEKLSSAAYALLSLPLGIVTFAFVVAGTTLSLGLTPIFIGLPILLFFLTALQSWMRFERKLALSVLGLEPNAEAPAGPETIGWFRKLGEALRSPNTYLSLLYGILKLPVGIFTFVVTVTLTCVSIALLLTPVAYWAIDRTLAIDIFQYSEWTHFVGLNLSPLQESLMYSAVGFVLLLVSVYITRAMAESVARLTLLFTEKQ